MVKGTGFELPPPGLGLTTVTLAVPALDTIVAGTTAVNSPVFTNVVARGVPFQFTTDPCTNPAPLTVNVNPGPAGDTAAGASGWFTKGTGLDWAKHVLAANDSPKQ